MNTPFYKTARFHRKLTLVCYPALLGFVVLWHGVLAPNEFLPIWLTLVIWGVPLLLPLKGILQGNPYTHAWANFILIFYFMHGFTTLYTHPQEIGYAIIEILLTTGAFFGATFYARYRGRELGLKLKRKKEEDAEYDEQMQAYISNAGKMPKNKSSD
ncbi:DUF2069 domain-containing protein [Aliidiomarina halalkaliphila]|uniref:DUF2069 domain-containing protein n=1 Tax=Aliidiomarina halalkaliphila TaxID=2593535 RepID=A0A552X4L8_9GAMM|nr:DUF2069 domain-containing protein [Aliidiomarina halalkaliphila]TRW49967.1 DUF2069 domain-containing protein [Aliidiomarina halalkaliphila]